MNPGGDFGKRELSPALRSRFTEIWVPQISDRQDFELVLNLVLGPELSATLTDPMLNYVDWFNAEICGDKVSRKVRVQ
jgi:midasin